jgi:hypothetical protein
MQFRTLTVAEWPTDWRTTAAAKDAVGQRCDVCAEVLDVTDDVIEDDGVFAHETCDEVDPEATADYLETTGAWRREVMS